MRFGRVIGTVSPIAGDDYAENGPGLLHLSVVLEERANVSVIRSEMVPSLRGPLGETALAWQADQYTQETIGNELALAGWEPIGIAESDETDGVALTASSPTYIVRFMQVSRDVRSDQT